MKEKARKKRERFVVSLAILFLFGLFFVFSGSLASLSCLFKMKSKHSFGFLPQFIVSFCNFCLPAATLIALCLLDAASLLCVFYELALRVLFVKL